MLLKFSWEWYNYNEDKTSYNYCHKKIQQYPWIQADIVAWKVLSVISHSCGWMYTHIEQRYAWLRMSLTIWNSWGSIMSYES